MPIFKKGKNFYYWCILFYKVRWDHLQITISSEILASQQFYLLENMENYSPWTHSYNSKHKILGTIFT